MKRHGTQLTINLSNLAYNYNLLRRNYPNNKVLFMVKANAYGHGAVAVVDYAFNFLDLREFGVASLGEALELRSCLPKMNFDIFVFSDLMLENPELRNEYSKLKIYPVIASFKDLKTYLDEMVSQHVPLVLKLDTGMHRLGIPAEDINKIVLMLKSKNIKSVHHLMTHFANSFLVESKSDKKTKAQYQLFCQAKKYLQENGIDVLSSSASNTGAIDQSIGLAETHIRPGLMMYGPSSLREEKGQSSTWQGKNVSSLSAQVIKIVSVKKGDEIGYGSMPAPKDGTIAILAIGYGDGFSCRFRNPTLKFNGLEGQILGRINMDTTMLIFDKSPDQLKLSVGDSYKIWGFNQDDIINLSHQTDTIPYEHFCQLTDRVPRIYIED